MSDLRTTAELSERETSTRLAADWHLGIDRALASIRCKNYDALQSILAAILKCDQLKGEVTLSPNAQHTFSKLRMFLCDARDFLAGK